jgi:hypothetical protein
MLEDCMALRSNFVTCSVILFTKCRSQSFHLQTWTGPSNSKSLRLPEFLDNRHLKAVKLSVLPTGHVSPLEISLVPISVRRRVDPRTIVRQEGISQCKIPMTPSGIAPATCQRLTQYLNQMHHRVLLLYKRNKLGDYNNSNGCRCPGLNFKQLAKFCETWKRDAPLEGFLNSLQLTNKHGGRKKCWGWRDCHPFSSVPQTRGSIPPDC